VLCKKLLVRLDPLPPNGAEAVLCGVLANFIHHCLELGTSTRLRGPGVWNVD